MKYIEIKEFIGKILTKIENNENYELIFEFNDGTKYKMYHEQDCCEGVSIDDINGDLQDLLNKPLLVAEEAISTEYTEEQNTEIEKEKKRCEEKGEQYYNYDESFTWTFYKLATINGYVTIKWHGESNGYYSESVDIIKADDNGNFSRW